MEKKNVFTKNKKAIVIALAVLVVGGIGVTVYASSQSKQKLAQAQNTVMVQTGHLMELSDKIDALFDSESPDFLAKDITEEQINTLRQSVDKETKLPESLDNRVDLAKFTQEKEAIEREMTALETTFEAQKTMNRLFAENKEKPAMNGTETNKDLPIVDNLQKETIETVKTEYFTENPETHYHRTINELVTVAEGQVNQIAKAKEAAEKVFKDNKVVSIDQKLYDAAKAEMDKIKNDKAKKDLAGQLDKVKAELDKKGKEDAEKAKKEQEAKEAEQQKATDQAKEQQNTTEAQQQEQAATDQGQSNGYTDNGGGYVAPAGGNTGGGYVPPTSGGGSGSTGGGSPSTGGGQTTTPPTGGGGSTGGNGSGGGGTTAPAGTVGPFYSEEDCWAYAESQGWSGFGTTIINGAMYISPR